MKKAWFLVLAAAIGCGGANTTSDAGGGTDASTTADTGLPSVDSGPGSSDSGPGPDATPAPDCTSYCAAIGAACTAANAQYGATDTCAATCAAFPPGAPGMTSMDTLGCRLSHAALASTAPDTHCLHAGPSGGGVCGSSCESFCTLAQALCTGANAQFTSAAECMTACAGYATTPAYSATVTSGNSFACRMYHLTAASTAPAVHCPHIGPTSAPCM